MNKIPENIRLKDLAIITNSNKPFFDDFISFLKTQNYSSLYEFVIEQDSLKAKTVLRKYLERKIPDHINLYDGVGRPCSSTKAKWLMLGWIFRDAPQQRLQSFIKIVQGKSPNERKAEIINQVRQYVADILPEKERWEWWTIAEVMMERLEGSRRAIKGTLFEAIVRRNIQEILTINNIKLTVEETQIKIGNETYDIKVSGTQGTILIPVKTRETMGGGHANLFTRDIYKAITTAQNLGLTCIPIIIAESWQGDINTLGCKNFIYINKNPNQIMVVEPLLAQELTKLLPVFQQIQ